MQKPDYRRALAWIFAAYGVAGLVWGTWVLNLAFFRATPPLPRSGDVVGPPDELVYRVGSALLLSLGSGVLSAAVLNLVASFTFLRRGNKVWMGFACVVDALAWAVVAILAVTPTLDFEADPMPWFALILVAAWVATMHLLATRFFWGRRAQAERAPAGLAARG